MVCIDKDQTMVGQRHKAAGRAGIVVSFVSFPPSAAGHRSHERTVALRQQRFSTRSYRLGRRLAPATVSRVLTRAALSSGGRPCAPEAEPVSPATEPLQKYDCLRSFFVIECGEHTREDLAPCPFCRQQTPQSWWPSIYIAGARR